MGFGIPGEVQWKFWKCVEEPEFGPGLPILTVYITGKLEPEDGQLQGLLGFLMFIHNGLDIYQDNNNTFLRKNFKKICNGTTDLISLDEHMDGKGGPYVRI